MDSHLLSNGLLWAALAVFVIVRQFMPRAIQPVAMIGLPLAAGYLGLSALAGAPPAGAAGVAILGLNLGLGAVMGLLRGVTVRVWNDPARGWMMQGTAVTFACWLVSIASNVGLSVAGHAAFSTSDIALLLGVTFAAQNLVVWARMAGLVAAGAEVRSR